MRPHLALGVDALTELPVVDAGDVQMLPGEIEQALQRLEQAVTTIARAGPIPVVLGGDHTITFPDATGVARHGRYPARVSLRSRDPDEAPDRVWCRAG